MSKLHQSFFFRLITRIVLISYIHGVFYPIYAADQQVVSPPVLPKIKPLYSVKVERIEKQKPVDPLAAAQPTLKVEAAQQILKLTIKTRASQDAPAIKQAFEFDPNAPLQLNPYFTERGGLILTNGFGWRIDGKHQIEVYGNGYLLVETMKVEGDAPLSLKLKSFGAARAWGAQAQFLQLVGDDIKLRGQNNITTLALRALSEKQDAVSIEPGATVTTRDLSSTSNLSNKGNLTVSDRAFLNAGNLTNADTGGQSMTLPNCRRISPITGK